MSNFSSMKPGGNWLEKFLRAILPVQKLVATRVAVVGATTTVNVTDTANTDASGNFSTDGFGRITGHARSDVALTLTVYQGDNVTTLDYSTVVAIPAAAGAGAGAAFSVEVIGRYAKVTVNNATAGANTVQNAAVYLRSV